MIVTKATLDKYRKKQTRHDQTHAPVAYSTVMRHGWFKRLTLTTHAEFFIPSLQFGWNGTHGHRPRIGKARLGMTRQGQGTQYTIQIRQGDWNAPRFG